MPSTVEQLLAQALLELKELKTELQQLREEMGVTPPIDGWLPPHEAWEALRRDGVQSQQHLKNLRLKGAFNAAKGDIRNVSNKRQPRWEYNIAKSRIALKAYFKRLQAMQSASAAIE